MKYKWYKILIIVLAGVFASALAQVTPTLVSTPLTTNMYSGKWVYPYVSGSQTNYSLRPEAIDVAEGGLVELVTEADVSVEGLNNITKADVGLDSTSALSWGDSEPIADAKERPELEDVINDGVDLFSAPVTYVITLPEVSTVNKVDIYTPHINDNNKLRGFFRNFTVTLKDSTGKKVLEDDETDYVGEVLGLDPDGINVPLRAEVNGEVENDYSYVEISYSSLYSEVKFVEITFLSVPTTAIDRFRLSKDLGDTRDWNKDDDDSKKRISAVKVYGSKTKPKNEGSLVFTVTNNSHNALDHLLVAEFNVDSENRNVDYFLGVYDVEGDFQEWRALEDISASGSFTKINLNKQVFGITPDIFYIRADLRRRNNKNPILASPILNSYSGLSLSSPKVNLKLRTLASDPREYISTIDSIPSSRTGVSNIVILSDALNSTVIEYAGYTNASFSAHDFNPEYADYPEFKPEEFDRTLSFGQKLPLFRARTESPGAASRSFYIPVYYEFFPEVKIRLGAEGSFGAETDLNTFKTKQSLSLLRVPVKDNSADRENFDDLLDSSVSLNNAYYSSEQNLGVYQLKTEYESDAIFDGQLKLFLPYEQPSYDEREIEVYRWEGDQWVKLIKDTQDSQSNLIIIKVGRAGIYSLFRLTEDVIAEQPKWSRTTISPAAIGNDSASISFYLEEEQYVSVNVYNMEGLRVYNMMNEKRQGAVNLIWDGRSNDGKLLDQGSYLVQVTSESSEINSVIRVIH